MNKRKSLIDFIGAAPDFTGGTAALGFYLNKPPETGRRVNKRVDSEHCTRCGAKWDCQITDLVLFRECLSCGHGCRDTFGRTEAVCTLR